MKAVRSMHMETPASSATRMLRSRRSATVMCSSGSWAAPVNPVDWKIREGHLKTMVSYDMPFIPGWDVSGVVEEVGKQATKFKVGESVFSRPDIARVGTYAEFVSIREGEVARKPATISHIEAGVLPLAGPAAWESLVDARGANVPSIAAVVAPIANKMNFSDFFIASRRAIRC